MATIDQRIFRPLPSRCRGYTQRVTISGIEVELRTREYRDGTLGEITLDVFVDDDHHRTKFTDFAAYISMCLQHGVALSTLVDMFVGFKAPLAGKVEGHEHIMETTSILDFVCRDLSISYYAEYKYSDILEELPIPSVRDSRPCYLHLVSSKSDTL